MKQIVLVGLGLALLIAVVSGSLWGGQAAFAAGVFGALATLIQATALALVKPAKGAEIRLFLKRWGIGMGLRLLGVVAIALAAGLDKVHFPPLPTATGFLGVLLPLLFFEARLIR